MKSYLCTAHNLNAYFFDTEKYLIKYKSIKTSMLSQIVNLDLLVYKNKKAFSFNNMNKIQNYLCK